MLLPLSTQPLGLCLPQWHFRFQPEPPNPRHSLCHSCPTLEHRTHGVDGWYIGPSIEHCRCHKCYIPNTFSVRDALTVDWFPHNVPFPKVTADEYLCQTADNMLTLIQDKTTHPIPSLTYGSNITNAYIQIAQILKRATALPEPAPLPPAPEQRVPLITPSPAPEQRVLIPAPQPFQPQQNPTHQPRKSTRQRSDHQSASQHPT